MENRPHNEGHETPGWVYRLGVLAISLGLIAGGAAGIRNYFVDKLTAAGAESIPYVGSAFIAVGCLGILASLSKNRQGPKS